MNRLHKRRSYYLILFVSGLAIGIGLILYSLKQNINAFITPSQIAHSKISSEDHLRLGGLVKKGSIIRDNNTLGVHFTVTDFKHEIIVYYQGVLPDLFREEKGVVTEGSLNHQGVFIADQVLAKHDENYMPKNVYDAMRRNTA